MFNTYTTPTADICTKHHVLFHRFADDIHHVNYNPMMYEPEHAKHAIIRRNKSMYVDQLKL